MADRIVDPQRTITFNTRQEKWRPDKINKRGKFFSINVPRTNENHYQTNRNCNVKWEYRSCFTRRNSSYFGGFTYSSNAWIETSKWTYDAGHTDTSFRLLIQSFTRTLRWSNCVANYSKRKAEQIVQCRKQGSEKNTQKKEKKTSVTC